MDCDPCGLFLTVLFLRVCRYDYTQFNTPEQMLSEAPGWGKDKRALAKVHLVILKKCTKTLKNKGNINVIVWKLFLKTGGGGMP